MVLGVSHHLARATQSAGSEGRVWLALGQVDTVDAWEVSTTIINSALGELHDGDGCGGADFEWADCLCLKLVLQVEILSTKTAQE